MNVKFEIKYHTFKELMPFVGIYAVNVYAFVSTYGLSGTHSPDCYDTTQRRFQPRKKVSLFRPS